VSYGNRELNVGGVVDFLGSRITASQHGKQKRWVIRLEHRLILRLQCRHYFRTERLLNHVFDVTILDCNWMLDW